MVIRTRGEVTTFLWEIQDALTQQCLLCTTREARIHELEKVHHKQQSMEQVDEIQQLQQAFIQRECVPTQTIRGRKGVAVV